MAKRIRPRVDKAAAAQTVDEVLEEAKAVLWDRLPDIIEKNVELALEGNATINAKILDILREMMREAVTQQGNDILDRIASLRQQSIKQVLDDPEQRRLSADLDAESGDGAVDTDAAGEASGVVPADDPPGPDN